MKVIVARIEWMSSYSGSELLDEPIGRWAKSGELPGEAYNFRIAEDGRYYGYWRVGEKPSSGKPARMSFDRWNDAGEARATGVTVVFIAKNPDNGSNVVVGFYENATVDSLGGERPDGEGRYRAFVDARDGYLLPVEDRIYRYNYRAKSRWFTYGDSSNADDVALLSYTRDLVAETTPTSGFAVEGYKKQWARRKERFQSPWLRSLVIRTDDDLLCAACGLRYQLGDHDALKRRFEVHHLERFSMLERGETRNVVAADLVVLCACCHRAVHGANEDRYISNISLFSEEVLNRK